MSGINRSRAAVVVGAFLLLTACNSTTSETSASGSPSGAAQGPTTAQEYVKGVCGAITTWQQAIQSRASALESNAASLVDPSSGKQALGDFFDGVIADTDTMISTIKDLGAPNVANGASDSAAFVGALTQVRDAFQHARDKIDQLPTDSATAFQNGAQQLVSSMSSEIKAAGTSLSNLNNPELETASKAEPACSSLTSGS